MSDIQRCPSSFSCCPRYYNERRKDVQVIQQHCTSANVVRLAIGLLWGWLRATLLNYQAPWGDALIVLDAIAIRPVDRAIRGGVVVGGQAAAVVNSFLCKTNFIDELLLPDMAFSTTAYIPFIYIHPTCAALQKAVGGVNMA